MTINTEQAAYDLIESAATDDKIPGRRSDSFKPEYRSELIAAYLAPEFDLDTVRELLETPGGQMSLRMLVGQKLNQIEVENRQAREEKRRKAAERDTAAEYVRLLEMRNKWAEEEI